MRRIPVSSSNLKSIGYDADTRILEIEFQTGAVYRYFQVPESEYKGLMSAVSHGKYFHANIRNRYRYEKARR